MSVLKHLLNGNLIQYWKSSLSYGFENFMLLERLIKRSPTTSIDFQTKIIGEKNIYLKPGVKIDRNCYLNAGGINNCGKDGIIELGEHVIVGYQSIIFAGGGEIYIGDKTRIGVGSILSAQSEDSFATPEVTPENHSHVFETIRIGKGCLIGGGARITGGTNLGDHCIVGAGAVVCGNYPAGTTLIGNPAKAIPRLPFEKK